MVGETNKVVIVTGGSSGIGRCTASALKENGCIVYEFSRRNIPMEGVTHLSVDVTNEDAVNAAVQQVIQKETKIDAVINCAGFGISGAVEFTSMEQAKAQFDVNFFGTVTVNKAVLPFLRRQGKGHIVNISSVAAVAHIPFQTFYSASKAAVSSYSYALANEVKPYGIHVTVVELGDICTGFTKARQKSILGDDCNHSHHRCRNTANGSSKSGKCCLCTCNHSRNFADKGHQTSHRGYDFADYHQ